MLPSVVLQGAAASASAAPPTSPLRLRHPPTFPLPLLVLLSPLREFVGDLTKRADASTMTTNDEVIYKKILAQSGEAAAMGVLRNLVSESQMMFVHAID